MKAERLAKRRVLLVTEDAAARQMFSAMLVAEGLDVGTHSALDDGLEGALAFAPDVLLVALDASRAATLTAIRRPLSLQVPMLIVAPLPAGPHVAIRLDADAFVPFPVSQPTLAQAVHRLCDDPPRTPRLLVIHGEERRRPSRPVAGAIKPCPRCGAAMRFYERQAAPVWLCVNASCRNQEFVRVADDGVARGSS
jgi:CheY-like chemotaxis protein